MRTTLVVLLTAALAGPAAQAEDLLEAYAAARESDPQLAAVASAREAALQSVPQARAGFLPNLSASAETFYNDVDSTPNRPDPDNLFGQDEDFESWGYAINLLQPVFRQANFVALRQANLSVQQAEADLAAAEQDLILRVSERYFDVLSAIDNLEFAVAEREAFARQLEQTRQRFEVGLIAITDVHEAQAAYDGAVAQEIAAENQLSDAREALREVSGVFYEDLSGLSEDTPLVVPEPADIDAWEAVAVEQNLQLRSAQLSANLAMQGVDLAGAQHYPTLDLVAGYSHDDSNSSKGSETDAANIGLQLNVSLYEGGRIQSEVRQAEAEHTRARDLLEAQRRATVLAARNAYRGVVSGISRVKALGQTVTSAKSALEATEAGYEVGTRTIVDVLNGQRTVFESLRNYSDARYDYIVQTLRLKQAAGQLSERDLGQVNGWLQ
jgi:outer membrane protein